MLSINNHMLDGAVSKEGSLKYNKLKLSPEELSARKINFNNVAYSEGLGQSKLKMNSSRIEDFKDYKAKLVPRKSLDENIEYLKENFKTACYIRTFSDSQFEWKIVQKKLELEKQQDTTEFKYYWSSSSVIKENCPLDLHLQGTRCGLVFAGNSELGGWNMQDMATDNPPKELSGIEKKNYFPAHFPDFAFSDLFKELSDNNRKTAKMILGRNGTCEEAQEFLLEAMDRSSSSHQTLLNRLPAKYKSAYTFSEVQNRMDQITLESKGAVQPYNEAKVHYVPRDIIGVFVSRDTDSIAMGKKLQENLSSNNIHVPFVTYKPNGTMEIFKKSEEIPTS